MNNPVITLILVGTAMFAIIGFLTVWSNVYSINSIKNKKVGHGQHGNARFATEKEIRKTYNLVPYEPKRWRKEKGDKNLPQGTVVGTRKIHGKLYGVIDSGEGDASSYGQNAFFYDAAEGLLTSVILLIAEYCKPEERHIISVFKMIQDLLAPASASTSKTSTSKQGKQTQFQMLMQRLPDTHKAKWFAGAALNTSEQAMQSVLSTALSRLNAFLDSEMEQILCFDTAIDAEKFCNTKSALFLIMPEEDNTKYFLVSLIVQQLYREMLAVADETGGKLKNRVMFYLDEIGTIPKIDSAEMMFSAGHSRRISIIAIIQSLAQHITSQGKDEEISIENLKAFLLKKHII